VRRCGLELSPVSWDVLKHPVLLLTLTPYSSSLERASMMMSFTLSKITCGFDVFQSPRPGPFAHTYPTGHFPSAPTSLSTGNLHPQGSPFHHSPLKLPIQVIPPPFSFFWGPLAIYSLFCLRLESLTNLGLGPPKAPMMCFSRSAPPPPRLTPSYAVFLTISAARGVAGRDRSSLFHFDSFFQGFDGRQAFSNTISHAPLGHCVVINCFFNGWCFSNTHVQFLSRTQVLTSSVSLPARFTPFSRRPST